MLAALLVSMSLATSEPKCKLNVVSGAEGENHVLFRGIAPAGNQIAVGWDRQVDGRTERGAFLLDLASGKTTALPELNNAPSFSPDGKHLIAANYTRSITTKTDLVELDLSTGKTRSFATHEAFEWLASYSNDGKWIVFNSTRTGNSDLYRVSRETGEIERITEDERYEAHAKFFDHDRELIFHRQTDGENYDIVVRNLATGDEETVGATAAEEAYPATSPDGAWIAFSATTQESTQPNLFIMRRDGSQRTRLTTGPDKDAYAEWSPDGRAIYFVRFATGGSSINQIEIDDGVCR